MVEAPESGGPAPVWSSSPVLLDYPFRGRWLVRNSPARRVPSHGSHALGTTYAIGFGASLFAPVGGRVVVAHDGEMDHVARRSQLTLLPYLLRQPGRVRGGAPAIAGNSTQPHVHVQVTDSTDWDGARGLPLAFPGRHGGAAGIPAEGEIVCA